MIAYSIDYKIIKNGKVKNISVDAKDTKSARSKIERLEAKQENKAKPQSKQTTKTRIKLLNIRVVGYY